MSFDAPLIRPHRTAIIGAGISGLAAAYLLAPQHAVTLFDAAPTLGGHARTVMAGRNGDQPVDTGFIVFNYANYPHLTRMFQDLEVPVAKSDMSFAVSINDGQIEYGLRNLRALAAQRRNLLRPGFARMVRDIGRFNEKAEALAMNDSATVGDLMDALRLGRWFQDYYLLPFCGAIWSTPPAEIRRFPARLLVQFFRNHALLGASGHHQWWTVAGGSVEYLRRLELCLRGRGVVIQTRTPVQSVTRDGHQSSVHSSAGPHEPFDQVIFACHADQALRLLARPTPQEQAALSAIRFQDNQMIRHRDASQMPRRKAVWSSWVYKSDTSRPDPAIGVALVAVIAEVSTPFGDRHSYLCHEPDFVPITRDTWIAKPKCLHVSPFQDVVGGREFAFDIRSDQITIRILHRNGDEGVVATLSGTRTRLTSAGLLRASFRHPFGALRTIGLIYWQALRLWAKGARYRHRPNPPENEVT